MEFVRLIHGYLFDGEWSKWVLLFPTPLALVTLVLFVWSIGPAINHIVRPSFVLWLRLTWFMFAYPAVLGLVLAIEGRMVPSAVAVTTDGLSKYGLPADPKRHLEHLMYAGFALLSLYVIELLIKEKLFEKEIAYKILPVVTLFLYGVVYMIGRVAIFPGNSHMPQ